jgi:hypothetical protein
MPRAKIPARPARMPQPGQLHLDLGDWTHNVTMHDYLHAPDHLKPRDYVLGFRWDCETSAQEKCQTLFFYQFS